MEEKQRAYHDGDTIYILLKRSQAESVLNEWLEGNHACDLRVHRSQKTKGCVVLETTNLMWANRIIRWFPYERVTYKSTKSITK